MGSSVVETTGKKKLSGTAKGYIILVGLVVLSWAIFKVLTPGNFGSPANMLSYFQASLIATVGAVGFYFVMVMGMFDFSIGANIMLSAIVGCVFASRFGMGYAGLIIGSVLTGTIVGLLNQPPCIRTDAVEHYSGTSGMCGSLHFLKLYKDWYVYICDRQQRVRSEKHGYQC